MIRQRLTLAVAVLAMSGTYGCPVGAPDWECRADKPCPGGKTCLSVDQSAPKCYTVCQVGDASGCPSGEGCSESEGVCLVHAPECTDHGDCWAGFRCDIGGSNQCVKCDDRGRDPDCRDPLAPAGLEATPGIEQVWLAWQAVDGAINYRLYMGYEPEVTEDDEEIGNVSGTTYLHADADPGQTHYYRVSAINEWSEGPLSNEVVVTPLAPAAPDKPAGVAATPGNQQVVVSWGSVDSAVRYRLYWHDDGAHPSETAIDDVQSPYAHAGLTNGTTYFYRVAARNAGGESPKSIEVSAKPGVVDDGAPQNLTAMPADSKVTLFWDTFDGADSYTVSWATDPDVTTCSGAPLLAAIWPGKSARDSVS